MTWRKLIGSPFCNLTPTQKHVLTQMARYGSKWGDDIFPSQREIARRAGVSVKCVCECMKRADREGWIVRYMDSGGRGYKRTTYKLAIPFDVEELTMFLKTKFWEPPFRCKIIVVDGVKQLVEVEGLVNPA